MNVTETSKEPASVERKEHSPLCSIALLDGKFLYHQQDGIRIFCGDNRVIAPMLGQYDCLHTDPPYGIGADKPRGDTGRNKHIKQRKYPTANWDSETPDADTIEMMLAKARWSIIWGGNYFPLPPRRGWLVWDKDNGDNYYADAELAWTNLDQAVRRMKYKWHGYLQENMAEKEVRYHPTQKPVPVMEWALGFVPECKTLLDPWAGSGTSLIAARAKGMQADGIEINEKYCEAAKQRLSQGVLLAV